MTVDLETEDTLESAVLAAIDAARASVWTALPGRVVAWDSGKQRATVQPQVRDVSPDRALPAILDVPVVFSRAGGYVITLPIEVGDVGLLVFSALSMGQWLASGAVSESVDPRRHALSSAVFLPGLSPDTLSTVPSGLCLGKTSNLPHLHPVALADKVDTWIAQMDTMFRSWAPLANDGGAALKTLFTSTFGTTPPTTVGSSDVRVTHND